MPTRLSAFSGWGAAFKLVCELDRRSPELQGQGRVLVETWLDRAASVRGLVDAARARL
jgi:hypothetical protein